MASPNLKSDLSIRKSLTTTAYEQLEELIVTTELEPGAILSEATLVEQLGIGRTPIREALQKLEREGLIRIMPRKGIEVTDLNPAKQLLMLELRRDLEKLLARSGALRATEEERSAFITIADAMAETVAAGNDVAFMRQDYALNQLMAQAAHNEYASRAIGLIHGLARRFWFVHFETTANMPLCSNLHANLAREVAQGDPETAATAVDALMDYLEEFTRATLRAPDRPT